jgi:hypothetical protein
MPQTRNGPRPVTGSRSNFYESAPSITGLNAIGTAFGGSAAPGPPGGAR